MSRPATPVSLHRHFREINETKIMMAVHYLNIRGKNTLLVGEAHSNFEDFVGSTKLKCKLNAEEYTETKIEFYLNEFKRFAIDNKVTITFCYEAGWRLWPGTPDLTKFDLVNDIDHKQNTSLLENLVTSCRTGNFFKCLYVDSRAQLIISLIFNDQSDRNNLHKEFLEFKENQYLKDLIDSLPIFMPLKTHLKQTFPELPGGYLDLKIMQSHFMVLLMTSQCVTFEEYLEFYLDSLAFDQKETQTTFSFMAVKWLLLFLKTTAAWLKSAEKFPVMIQSAWRTLNAQMALPPTKNLNESLTHLLNLSELFDLFPTVNISFVEEKIELVVKEFNKTPPGSIKNFIMVYNDLLTTLTKEYLELVFVNIPMLELTMACTLLADQPPNLVFIGGASHVSKLQTMLNFLPKSSKDIVRYRSHFFQNSDFKIPYSDLQLLKQNFLQAASSDGIVIDKKRKKQN